MEDSAAGRTAMGPQGPGGRKRVPNQEKRTAEDETLNQVAREAEARLAARRAARAEAREIRMKELERQHRELSLSHQVQLLTQAPPTKPPHLFISFSRHF